MITISTTSPDEARAMAVLMGGAPAGISFRVDLHGREVAASLPLPSAPGWKALTLDLKVAGWVADDEKAGLIRRVRGKYRWTGGEG